MTSEPAVISFFHALIPNTQWWGYIYHIVKILFIDSLSGWQKKWREILDISRLVVFRQGNDVFLYTFAGEKSIM